jgi:hypothetical protein
LDTYPKTSTFGALITLDLVHADTVQNVNVQIRTWIWTLIPPPVLDLTKNWVFFDLASHAIVDQHCSILIKHIIIKQIAQRYKFTWLENNKKCINIKHPLRHCLSVFGGLIWFNSIIMLSLTCALVDKSKLHIITFNIRPSTGLGFFFEWYLY